VCLSVGLAVPVSTHNTCHTSTAVGSQANVTTAMQDHTAGSRTFRAAAAQAPTSPENPMLLMMGLDRSHMRSTKASSCQDDSILSSCLDTSPERLLAAAAACEGAGKSIENSSELKTASSCCSSVVWGQTSCCPGPSPSPSPPLPGPQGRVLLLPPLPPPEPASGDCWSCFMAAPCAAAMLSCWILLCELGDCGSPAAAVVCLQGYIQQQPSMCICRTFTEGNKGAWKQSGNQ
jgi:hypothetical protein